MWYHRLASWAKDTMAVVALLSFTMTILVFLFSSKLEPFLELPVALEEVRKETALIRNDFDRYYTPKLVRFQGLGLVVGTEEAKPGGHIDIIHFLRREASCETLVRIQFYNVDTGRVVQGPTIPAQKAPVTNSFIPFPLRINLPEEMKSGERYVYYPIIKPIECGVYETEFRAAPTGIFTVK